jgi:hypothetical protein
MIANAGACFKPWLNVQTHAKVDSDISVLGDYAEK